MAEQERDYETEARSEGWVPQEEWNGPDDKWVDAQKFVEKGEQINPILRKKVSRLEEQMASMEQANAATNKKFGDYHKKEVEKLQSRISELKQERKQAVTESDGDTFERVDQQISQLESQVSATDTSVEEQNAMANRWVASNQWYTSDEVLASYADGIAERIAAQGYQGQAFYNELTRKTKEAFPEKFENPNRSRANGVEAGGTKGSVSKKQSYDNLPDDAKAACDDFVSQGFMTQEDYVGTFDWESENV
jgi:DNA-binding ferritin-like protein